MDIIIILFIIIIIVIVIWGMSIYTCSCNKSIENYDNYNTNYSKIVDMTNIYEEIIPDIAYDSEQVEVYKNTDWQQDIYVNNAFPKNSFDLRNNAQYDHGWTDNNSNAVPKECIRDFRNVKFCAN